MVSLFFEYSLLERFKNNTFIILRNIENGDKNFTYEDALKSSQRLQQSFDEFNIPKQSKIAIQFEKSVSICTVILTILNHRCAFCPMSVDSLPEECVTAMKRFGTKYLFTSNEINIPSLKLMRMLTELSESIFVYEYIELDSSSATSIPNHCYCIQTSGTTGLPKIVQVPYECISPNITELSKILRITVKDVILLSSPPTFDPFVVEFFLTIYNGCSLLITSNFGSISPLRYATVLFSEDYTHNNVTLMQMTPSVFRSFGTSLIREQILHKNSSLKTLILGGEPFPQEELMDWINENTLTNKTIFNIYGITEVSCWSTISQFIWGSEISIGEPIDKSTLLQVFNSENNVICNGEGELHIGSKERICYLDNESIENVRNKTVYRPTGDLVKIVDNRLYYKSRTNDVIKRFGHRINLKSIETSIMSLNYMKQATLVHIIEKNILIFFIILTEPGKLSTEHFTKFIQSKLQKHERPDVVLHVSSFPITSHGKLAKHKLIDIYERNLKKSAFEVFTQFCKNVFGYTPINSSCKRSISKRTKGITNSSFLSLGGTSFQALSLVSEIEKISNTSQPSLFEMFLNETTSIEDIFNAIKAIPISLCHKSVKRSLQFTCNIKIIWKYNTHKCIDATPTVCQLKNGIYAVSVGSHSHKVVNLDANSGTVLSNVEFPDRIESEVVVLNDEIAFVGCYDGCLYQFGIMDGNISWKYNTGGMIKCKPLVLNKMSVCVGNYSKDDNLFFFEIKPNKLRWSTKVGTKGILSSPIELPTGHILVCTLDGTCASIDPQTGKSIWQLTLLSPIFATCKVLNANIFLLAEVKGVVRCIDINGIECWSYESNGSIFSSFEVIENLIFFGCHDGHIYCLKNAEHGIHQPELLWKTNLHCQIYSTPKIDLNNRSRVIAVATNGNLYVIDVNFGTVLENIKLNSEVFSTPCFHDKKCFVGCRDNNLYALQIR